MTTFEEKNRRNPQKVDFLTRTKVDFLTGGSKKDQKYFGANNFVSFACDLNTKIGTGSPQDKRAKQMIRGKAVFEMQSSP